MVPQCISEQPLKSLEASCTLACCLCRPGDQMVEGPVGTWPVPDWVAIPHASPAPTLPPMPPAASFCGPSPRAQILGPGPSPCCGSPGRASAEARLSAQPTPSAPPSRPCARWPVGFLPPPPRPPLPSPRPGPGLGWGFSSAWFQRPQPLPMASYNISFLLLRTQPTQEVASHTCLALVTRQDFGGGGGGGAQSWKLFSVLEGIGCLRPLAFLCPHSRCRQRTLAPILAPTRSNEARIPHGVLGEIAERVRLPVLLSWVLAHARPLAASLTNSGLNVQTTGWRQRPSAGHAQSTPDHTGQRAITVACPSRSRVPATS
ncbi:uncharacterized protein LOC119065728 isoform X1 [Artibeus jamaicensis]|uniref:uncharacterized protein LOC119065728 isoform X1 n=1 Tax=Artibeus jamaicensis TaxID=9417 RepID=UPI00235B1555|nr:uncharacterized protein LOC119065728 isoform X1 [Artibeus jamaicensis]XP_053512046.1 uncharacterized protein LOC119065728 isoform X1 [Artibeus jamaicensis]XP_053512047.1 uncharacterized protein LOC119065728 isoform X1 [Artibeus jamaicensis]